MLPSSLPGNMLMPHLSARKRNETCDVVFEMLGGTDRLYSEANRDREAYWEFMKLWSKGLPRAVATEQTPGNGVEDMLDRLDDLERADKAITIDMTPK